MTNELVGGRYRLEERLGAGAMSEVWAAHDVELGRRVAVKLLARDADPARFDREARAVAALAHPNICQLYDYGKDKGRAYMVLEYLGGGTLEERLGAGEPLPDEEAGRIARDIALGLAHAHERGLVHRDLKPANILFDSEGRPKIADFGIARLGGAMTLTEAGTLLGTAAYISPEQAEGLPATPASDVYSFGVILYRMLTGRLPFEAESPLELARMHISEPPLPADEARADVPQPLAAVAMASMAKDPAERPADGAALVEALATGETTISAAPTLIAGGGDPTVVLPRRRARPPAWRSRATLPLVIAAVLVLAATGVALAVLASRSSNASQPTTSPPTRRARSTRAGTTVPARATTGPTTTTARTTTAGSTRRTTTHAATSTSSPPPPPPPPVTIPTTTPTVPTTVSIPITTPPPPPPPPSP